MEGAWRVENSCPHWTALQEQRALTIWENHNSWVTHDEVATKGEVFQLPTYGVGLMQYLLLFKTKQFKKSYQFLIRDFIVTSYPPLVISEAQ